MEVPFFIKNPLKGYGIFIENMLSEAEKSNNINVHLHLL